MRLSEIAQKLNERLVFLRCVTKYLLSQPNFHVDHSLLQYWLVKCFLTGRLANKLFKIKGLTQLGRRIRTEWTGNFLKCVIKDGMELCICVHVRSKEWAEGLPHEILEGEHYFHRAVQLREGDVVIDGGWHIGIFSIAAAIVFKCAKVYVFEPEEENYSFLLKNVRNIENIVPIRCALGNTDSISRLYIHEDAGAHSLVTKSDKFQDISICKPDSFVEKEGLDRIDFIKLDVEGYEAQVLEGARNVLKKYQPKLAISAYHHFYDMFVLPELILTINPNYSIVVINKGHQPMVFAW